MIRRFAIAALVAIVPLAAPAAPCPGNPDALGTARVLAVDANSTPRVGRKSFPTTLPLGRKELVLTFDDGPWPGTTPKVLDALKHECVRATFFLLGRNVEAHPEIARRELAEGHSLGHHTFSHPLLARMAPAKAEAEIDRGIAEDELVLYGQRRNDPTTPFFRFPGFASNRALLDRLQARHMVVFGADVWASDWLPMGAGAGIAADPVAASSASAAASCFSTTPRSRPPRCFPPCCASSNGADTASFTSSRPEIGAFRAKAALFFAKP